MAEVFLSDAWWRLAEEPASEDSSDGSAVVNLRVERGPEGEKRAHLTGRRLVPGHSGAAVATVTLPFTVAHAVFVEGKLQDAMSAYAAGKTRVEGSMAGLGAIAGTDEVGPLRERLRGITAPLGDGPSLTGAAARRRQGTDEDRAQSRSLRRAGCCARCRRSEGPQVLMARRAAAAAARAREGANA